MSVKYACQQKKVQLKCFTIPFVEFQCEIYFWVLENAFSMKTVNIAFLWIFGRKKVQGRSQTFQNEGVARGAQGWGWGGGADWDSKWRLSMIDLCTKCNFIWGLGGRVSARGQSPPCPLWLRHWISRHVNEKRSY